MFNPGDTAYFLFCGDWRYGNYKGHYCLPLTYYPFMPIKIEQYRMGTGTLKGRMMCVVTLSHGGYWSLSVDCIEKEFSIDKFILAQAEWGKTVTNEQFKYILSTIGR